MSSQEEMINMQKTNKKKEVFYQMRCPFCSTLLSSPTLGQWDIRRCNRCNKEFIIRELEERMR